MDLLRTGIFDLAERRMLWAGARQSLLAGNVANANTPGYRARDVVPFATSLEDAAPPLPLAATAGRDIAGEISAGPASRTDTAVQVAPDGNAVALDDELAKIADTQGTMAVTQNLYQKYLGFFRTAFGHGS